MNSSLEQDTSCLSQGLFQMQEALELSDLELFARAWSNASESERCHFVENDGDLAMKDAFGVSYLRIFVGRA